MPTVIQVYLGLAIGIAIGFLSIAALVLVAAPRRAVNRALALYFALWSASMATSLASFLVPDRFVSYNAGVWAYATTWAAMPAYAIFFSRALGTPLVRPLATRAGTIVLAALGIAIVVGVLAFHTQIVPATPATPEPEGARWLHAILPIGLTAGFVASLDAVRRSFPRSIARRRSVQYAIAFGVFDLGVGMTVVFTDFVDLIPGFTRAFLIQFSMLASLVLVTVALLRYQLFDFDLKVKWTLRRGTLVGIFVSAFIIVAAIVEQWLQRYGVVIGGIAVGLLFLALRPLERAADRLADKAMPNVKDTAEYRLVRKREVYRAALESAMLDGVVTDRERSVLATLATELGLTPVEALDIERGPRVASTPSVD